MKKLLSCLLVLAMFLSLGVFGGWNGRAYADDEQSPVGTWVGSLDMKDFLTEADEDLGALLDNALASVTVELREDGTYSLSFDASPMIPSVKAALYAYVEQLCTEYGMTLEEFEEAYGSSIDELVEEAMAEFNSDEINQYVEGVYELVGDQVLFDGGDTRGTFTGNTLIIDVDDFGEVVLTRAGIYGMWIAQLDLVSFMGESDEGLIEALKDVTMQVILELRSDETFTLTIDASEMLPAMRVALRGYLENMLAESGMTVEQFESLTGSSLDALLDEAFAEMDVDSLGGEVSGTFEQTDGQLVLNGDGSDQIATLNGSTLSITVEGMGDLNFVQVYNEDVLAKSEGVMTYAEYAAAELDSPVVIEAYVLDHQSWWKDQITVYAQDADGAYFMYNMACSEGDAAKLVPGQKIRVTGFKAEWAGEVEIVDASFELVNGSYQFRPVDVTALLGTNELIDYQNRLVAFKGMTVEPYDESGAAFAYKDPDGKTDDLYFKVSKDGVVYEFCVEYYLRGNDTPVYQGIETLNVGDTVDLTGYLYWYEGPNPHIISVTVK